MGLIEWVRTRRVPKHKHKQMIFSGTRRASTKGPRTNVGGRREGAYRHRVRGLRFGLSLLSAFVYSLLLHCCPAYVAVLDLLRGVLLPFRHGFRRTRKGFFDDASWQTRPVRRHLLVVPWIYSHLLQVAG